MTLRTKTSKNRTANVKQRPYVALVNAHDSNTSNTRDTLATPAKGRRIRLLRARVIQEQADGRHLWELYFGTGSDITVSPEKAVDILDVPNEGEVASRTFLKSQGPRGSRDEVLSGRWLGTPPTTVHKIVIEYTEES